MRNATIALACLALAPLGCVHAEDPGFPPAREVGDQRLVQTGEGTLRFWFWTVYDAAFYTVPEASLRELPADLPMRLEIFYQREVSAEKIVEAAEKIMERVVPKTKIEAVRPELDRINEAYVSVSEGDRYTLTYLPEKGTTLALNGEPQLTVSGYAFAEVYFSLWVSAETTKPNLRNDLLGLAE